MILKVHTHGERKERESERQREVGREFKQRTNNLHI